ncbi:MAG: DUF3868 domain-containing protein [Bacteroidales bacterium]|nr:DUF3868 domain-containing protein [Bacteroidales bacterium]
MKIKYILFAFVMMTAVSHAQTSYLQGVKVENLKIGRLNDKMGVSMNVVIDGLDIKPNDMVILTPVIKSNHDETSVQLAPIVLAGHKRFKILKRKQMFHNPLDLNNDKAPYTIVRRSYNEIQTVAYTTELSRTDWMKDASLVLNENVKGCADCNRGEGLSYTVDKRFLPGDYKPTYKVTYLMPEAEVKTRSEKHSATFNFVVDRYELHRDYKNNAVKLNEVDRIIHEIQNNTDFNITKLDITGYASPEASVAHNRILAKNRAEAFANYLISTFGIPRTRLLVKSYGEDWNGLRKAVVGSTLADRQAVLNIIDQISNPDARDVKLNKLSGGATYRTLLDEYYPPLRRTEYTIVYNVRPFSVEEAREIIKTNPKLLNLNEMYMVAQSYPTGSKEFKEVFDISARLYPNNELSILNSASSDIEAGNVNGALERLSKISNNAKAWNDLGVGYALKGNLSQAKNFLDKAANNGDTHAKHNLEELEKVVEQQ